jgi:hypothetical protein
MSNHKRPKFSGELNKPIVSNLTAFLLMNSKPSENDLQKFWELESERIVHHQVEKLDLLLNHYGIKPDSEHRWVQLSICLAREIVPGMMVINQTKRSKGRPGKWNSGEGIKLIMHVEEIRKERNRGTRDAIRNMVKRYPDQWGLYKGKERDLEVRYWEAKKYRDQFIKTHLQI